VIDVVHLITSLDTGGAQRMLLKLLERLDRGRFRASVISLVDDGPLAEEVRGLGLDCEGLGMRPGVPDPRGFLRLRAKLARRRPQVLQTWLYHADLLGLLAGRVAGVPAVAWNIRCMHWKGAGRGLAARAAPRLCALLSRAPDAVVVNSSAGRSSHAASGYRPQRWCTIPNGFDLERFRPDEGARRRLRSELGLGADALLAGMVARWHPVKNHAGLLDALARLRDRHPDLHLVLVGEGTHLGEGGAHDAACRSAVAERGLADRVHGLGERKDVGAILPGLDLLVSPSFHEGFPNVLGEALACAVPCVATDAGDSAEIVGEAGVVADGTDGESLARAIDQVVGLPPDERRALGRAGRERVAERYGMERVVAAYEALYAELSGGAPCAA